MHYNAFISYKHADLDNKIAATIEKDLEHYHIPFKLRKKTGYKKIERIFRDTDELPITSDLSGTIEEALKNADFLIVLCSTNTCKSMWVEREIKLFLQTHSQNQILTVIADGEPRDVIPKILQNKEVKRVNDQAVEETFIEPVEPLCCDYRLSKREAKRVELPRLVATLIGCSYNELMDRQRQYKMRRLTAIMSIVLALAVGFGAYMVYSNNKINESYRQALVSQSRYLSNESEKYLDNEQRITALQLALAALPNESNPTRPIIPEAVRAISRASLAYVPVSGSNITSIWNYTMHDQISEFDIAKGGKTLAAIDYSDNVMVWNTENHDVIFEYSSADDRISEILYLNSDTLLLQGSNFLRGVDVTNGTIKWEQSSEEFSVIGKEVERVDDDSFLVYSYRTGLVRLSSKDGSVIEKIAPPAGVEDKIYYHDLAVSPSGEKIVFTLDLGEDEKQNICVQNLKDKSCKLLDLQGSGILFENGVVKNLDWIDDDTLGIGVLNDTSNSNYGFLNMNVYTTNHVSINLVDANTLEKKWDYDFTFTDIAIGSGFMKLPDINAVAFYKGNMCDIWDIETGELLYTHNTNDPIVGIQRPKGDTFPIYFTQNGGFVSAMPSNGNDAVSVMTYFTDEISQIIMSNGAYVRKRNSSEIIYYGVKVADDEFTEYEGDPAYDSYISTKFNVSGDIAAVGVLKDAHFYVAIYNAADKKFMCQILLDEDKGNSSRYNILGVYNNKLYVSSLVDKAYKLIEIDYATGEKSEKVLVQELSTYSDCSILRDGKLVYFDKENYSSNKIYVYDIATQKTDEYVVLDEGYYSIDKLEYKPESGIIFAAGNYDFIINTGTGEVKEVIHSEDWNGTKMVVIDETERKIVLSNEKTIIVYDFEGNELYDIECPDVAPFTAAFHDSMLLVPFSDAYLARYNAETGELIAKSEITCYSSSFSECSLTFDEENGIILFQQGTIIDIIDEESWTDLAYLTQSFGYHKATNTFISSSKNDDNQYSIGYFKHYSVDELVEKAKKLLNGTELSDDLKRSYGIG